MASARIQRQIERLLDEAEDASAERNWEVVRERAQRVLTFDPDNPDGLALLAAAERALGPSASSPSDPMAPAALTPALNPLNDQRSSFANGRYQVQKFLGEGGKKRVYLALATATARREGDQALEMRTLANAIDVHFYHLRWRTSSCAMGSICGSGGTNPRFQSN